MNFVYCDPGLANHRGHHANYCRTITSELRRRGIDTTILVPATAQPELLAALGAAPHFRVSNAACESLWDDPLCGFLKNFDLGSDLTAEDLARLEGLGPEDVIFFTYTRPFHLMACITWAQTTFAPDACPHFVFEFCTLPETTSGGSHAAGFGHGQALPALFRFAQLALKPEYRPRFHFVASTQTFARTHGAILDAPVIPVPMPQTASTPPRLRQGSADGITLSFLGSQADYKGFELLPDLAARLLASRPEVRLLIHNSAHGLLPATARALRTLAARENRIEYLDGGEDLATWRAWIDTMDWDRWAALLHRSDLLVLPYHPGFYADIPSGVAAEGLANGIPLVTPLATATGQLLADFGYPGVLFASNTLEEVTEAVLLALDRFDELAIRAFKAREKWAARMGAGPFVTAILNQCR